MSCSLPNFLWKIQRLGVLAELRAASSPSKQGCEPGAGEEDSPGMDTNDLAGVLAKPMAAQLLRSEPLARLAYVGLDELPRVVPVSFWWKNGQLSIYTIPASAKVKALQRHPAVAITIDHDGLPPRALLLRGRAHIEMVEGVPDGYVQASLKTQSGRAAEDFGANVRAMYQSMAVISVELTWARLNDFETTLPKAVEEIIANQQT